ncbi:MAG: nitroreductase family protein [Clostridium perfringens]|nr:nitroreductase family protein [Clostridium perfringens]
MNDIISNIISRRSTRAFTEESVDQDILKEILTAGLYAPSSKNKQLWHFTVIQNKDILNELNESTKEAVKKYGEEKISNPDVLKAINTKANNDSYDTFYKAPVAILISKDINDATSQDDCAAASQNIMLAAHSHEIGSCWVGFIKYLFLLDDEKSKEYHDKFSIPKGYIPTHAIVLGHKKNSSPKASDRRDNTISYIY